MRDKPLPLGRYAPSGVALYLVYVPIGHDLSNTCTYMFCVKFSTRMKSAEERLVPNCTGKGLDSRMAIAKLWRKSNEVDITSN